MRYRYSDEQLSRILGEHAAGWLARGGQYWWGKTVAYPAGCANQVAFNEGDAYLALGAYPEGVDRFDAHYEHDMTPEALLALLEGENA